MDEWLTELKAQLESHTDIVFTLENSDNVTLEIADVEYQGMDDVVVVTMRAIYT